MPKIPDHLVDLRSLLQIQIVLFLMSHFIRLTQIQETRHVAYVFLYPLWRLKK